ncbi:MAG: hypothetical protein M1434_14580 [Chloroflexi bacterium]|nr:hypothetical protein [Chloroflexota bacterium]MCL5275944.1 hypothetical protein [Chloroflexota bacterium]
MPAILLRIGQHFRYGISADELYDETRGIWRVNLQLHQPKYAFSVYRGIVRGVYEIESWHKAGTTPYKTRTDIYDPDRWEFKGTVAEEAIRVKFIDMSVVAYLSASSRNPVKYINC